MRKYVALVLTLLPQLAPAAEPLSAAQFDAYTKGKTLLFGQMGRAYGAERYLEGRRVIWSFLDGQCQDGIWYPQGNQICFVYDNNPDPQCWVFTQDSGGLIAQFQGDSNDLELYEARDAQDEMICLGPKVGV